MAFILHDHSGVIFHTAQTLEHPAIVHGFTTRLGGVSTGHCASLNLRGSGTRPDRRENVLENYRRLCAAVGAEMEGLVLSRQVHGDTIRRVTSADAGKGLLSPADYTADALVTDQPGLCLTVFSADCIILLLHDPVSRCIGAVHAGWRGTALDLPAKAVSEMGRLFGARPENIRVAIGAGIGPCCFETHDDVPDALRTAFGPEVEQFISPCGGKWTVDLKAVNRWRLHGVGITPAHLDVCPLCTGCHPELYWSHRKTGDLRGVQGALIALKKE